MQSCAFMYIDPEVSRKWADEFAPIIAADERVTDHQFWFGWDDVAAACQTVLTEEFDRLKTAIQTGKPAAIRAGDFKGKVLGRLLDPSWWETEKRGKHYSA